MIAIGSYFVIIVSVMGMIHDPTCVSHEERDQFFQYILNEHNNYRRTHGSDDMILHGTSTLRANKLIYNWMDTSNVPNKPGVNTFSIKLSEISKLDAELAKKIVATWYNTGDGYNYDVEPFSWTSSNTSDPFTQIVWKRSKNFGVAIKASEDTFYLLAHYIPKGNIREKYIENVTRPSHSFLRNSINPV